eukprot:tig00020951_g16447.t1
MDRALFAAAVKRLALAGALVGRARDAAALLADCHAAECHAAGMAADAGLLAPLLLACAERGPAAWAEGRAVWRLARDLGLHSAAPVARAYERLCGACQGDPAAAADIAADLGAAGLEPATARRPRASLGTLVKRWRQVIEQTEWPDVDLRIKLRLGGASLCLRVELPSGPFAIAGADSGMMFAVCRLLAAITTSGSRSVLPRPKQAVVELLGGPCPFDFDVDDEDREAVDYSGFVSAYLLGVLRALRPAEGAASTLESLSVGITHEEFARPRYLGYPGRSPYAWPRANELQAALAPFGQLHTFTVSFNGSDSGVGPDAAAAIANCCPLLRSLVDLELILDSKRDPTPLRAIAEAIHTVHIALTERLNSCKLILDVFEAAGAQGARALAAPSLQYRRRPLEEAEAAAVVALPSLRRLRIRSDREIDSASPSSVRPFEILRRLRPEVSLELAEWRKSRATLRAMFEGRPSFTNL